MLKDFRALIIKFDKKKTRLRFRGATLQISNKVFFLFMISHPTYVLFINLPKYQTGLSYAYMLQDIMLMPMCILLHKIR